MADVTQRKFCTDDTGPMHSNYAVSSSCFASLLDDFLLFYPLAFASARIDLLLLGMVFGHEIAKNEGTDEKKRSTQLKTRIILMR